MFGRFLWFLLKKINQDRNKQGEEVQQTELQKLKQPIWVGRFRPWAVFFCYRGKIHARIDNMSFLEFLHSLCEVGCIFDCGIFRRIHLLFTFVSTVKMLLEYLNNSCQKTKITYLGIKYLESFHNSSIIPTSSLLWST